MKMGKGTVAHTPTALNITTVHDRELLNQLAF
jgi:hypothetical protein